MKNITKITLLPYNIYYHLSYFLEWKQSNMTRFYKKLYSTFLKKIYLNMNWNMNMFRMPNFDIYIHILSNSVYDSIRAYSNCFHS